MTNSGYTRWLSEFGEDDLKYLAESLPSCFNSSTGLNNLAFLNWRFDFNGDLEGKFFSIGEGYFEASLTLIEECLKSNYDKKADIFIFPILHNLVHAVEVYLKGFNSLYKVHVELKTNHEISVSSVQSGHNIKSMCQEAIGLLKKHDDSDVLYMMEFVQKFIDDLYSHTNDMTFSRYPVTKRKTNHFYVQSEGNVTINLVLLRQWAMGLYFSLDSLTSLIDYQNDYMKDVLVDLMSDWT